MDIQATTNYTITVNGVAYSFADPHPIVALIDQLDGANQELAMWSQRQADATTRIADLQAQITALCVTPA